MTCITGYNTYASTQAGAMQARVVRVLANVDLVHCRFAHFLQGIFAVNIAENIDSEGKMTTYFWEVILWARTKR